MNPENASPRQDVDDQKKSDHTQIDPQVFLKPLLMFVLASLFRPDVKPMKIEQQSPTKGGPMNPENAWPRQYIDGTVKSPRTDFLRFHQDWKIKDNHRTYKLKQNHVCL